MVATTFAADTPLVVTGLVSANGVAGNWLWWNMLMSGMLTVFFFARLWRRANVMTDVEFAEVRYSGKPAAALRGLPRAVPRDPDQPDHPRLGDARDDQDPHDLARPARRAPRRHDDLRRSDRGRHLLHHHDGVLGAAGMWAVLWTDLVQFVDQDDGGDHARRVRRAARSAAWTSMKVEAGRSIRKRERGDLGSPGEVRRPAALRRTRGCRSSRSPFSCRVQWWAAWYPGAEPGGGGYIAQRIFSAQTERDGVLATLFFQVAHYAMRPWPWIITGLATVILYPNGIGPKHDHEAAYVQAFVDLLPTPWRGFMMAGFAAAYMSTVATQLNWGASYLVNDFYKRFMNKDGDREALRLDVARCATVAAVPALDARDVAALVRRRRVEVSAGDRRGHRAGAHSPLVLVAHQRVVRDQRDARVVRDLGDLFPDGTRPLVPGR